VRVRVKPSSIALLLALAVAALLLRNAFVAAHRQIGWAVACIIVAALLAPFVNVLDRKIPRWLALLITMLGSGALTAVVWAGVVVNLSDGFNVLKKEAPRAAASLENRYNVAREFRLSERVDSLIEQFRASTTGGAVGRAVGAAGTYLVCGILTLFFMIYGPRILGAMFRQIRDEQRRERIERQATDAMRNSRRYILASIAQAVVVALAIGFASWILSVPAPFVLGVLAGMIGLVPTLGIIVGGLPALLLAAGLGDWQDAIILLVVLVVLQAIEVTVVRRRIDRASVHVGPALPAIVALLGYELYGIGGATYGAAALVFLIAWLDAVGIDADGVDPDGAGDTPEPVPTP